MSIARAGTCRPGPRGTVLRWTRAAGLALALVLFLAATAHADEPVPFQLPSGHLIRIDDVVARAVAGDRRGLRAALARDPFLSAQIKELGVDAAVTAAAAGSFDARAFNARAAHVVRRYIRAHRADLARRYRVSDDRNLTVVLSTKIASLATFLDRAQRKPPRSRSPARSRSSHTSPRPSATVGRVFGAGATTMAMVPARGAAVVRGSAQAAARYGWLLAAGQPGTAEASARVETGRAVYFRDEPMSREGNASRLTSTQMLVKGVGVTPYAGNVFNAKTTGTFPLDEGISDWDYSQTLAAAGVPVYEPVALIALPYWEWSSREGVKPLAVYARRPQENLRVSDLGILPPDRRRDVARGLRAKIAALTGSRADAISNEDLVRFFATRLGRVAGLFEGGTTLGGKRYFHGMLHLQNVSLMGEIVDLGYNDGLVTSDRALREAYRKSGYRRRDRNWPAEIVNGTSEKAVLRYLVAAFYEDLGAAIPAVAHLPRTEVMAVFERAYTEGRRGQRATSARQVLASARRSTRPTTSPVRQMRARLARTSATTRRPRARAERGARTRHAQTQRPTRASRAPRRAR